MKKLTNRITALAALVFIAAFGVSTVLFLHSGKGDTMLPELTLESLTDGSFGKELGAYAADSFAGRDGWVSAGSRLGSGINGNVVNGVYISDERLISADISDRESTEKSAELINGFAEKYDGAAYFVAVPTSAGVYGDALPDSLSETTEKQQIDVLYEQLSGSIRKIDAYNLLKMLSDDPIYFKSDSKWTMYGAYCVYRTVIQKLGFQPVSYDKYTVRHITDEYRGDLYEKTLYMRSGADILDIYEYPDGEEIKSCISYDNDGNTHMCSIYDTEAVGSEDMYSLYLGEKQPVVRIVSTVNNDRRLLLIGSECAACFVPFLIQHYSEITVVLPEYAERSMRTFLDPNDYEQTLFLFGIDAMNSETFEKLK